MTTSSSFARIRWACRRGMLELDLLLEPYAMSVYPDLPATEQAQFCVLLDQDDPLLWEWFSGQSTPPIAMHTLVADILRYKKSKTGGAHHDSRQTE